MNEKCPKCDGKLIYATTFKIDFEIICGAMLSESNTTMLFWICACCSRLYCNTTDDPKLHEIGKHAD